MRSYFEGGGAGGGLFLFGRIVDGWKDSRSWVRLTGAAYVGLSWAGGRGSLVSVWDVLDRFGERGLYMARYFSFDWWFGWQSSQCAADAVFSKLEADFEGYVGLLRRRKHRRRLGDTQLLPSTVGSVETGGLHEIWR